MLLIVDFIKRNNIGENMNNNKLSSATDIGYLENTIYPKIKGTCVLDIGANVGAMSELFLSYSPDHIFCIEPNKTLCSKISNTLLEKGFTKNDFTVLNFGLSDSVCDLKNVKYVNCWTLDQNGNTGLDISPGAEEEIGVEPFDVKLFSLDSLLELNYFEGMDIKFIKIDVDGYESKVLNGGINFLNKYNPIILFELCYLPENFGDSISSMLDLIFDDLGYSMYKLNGEKVSKQFAVDNFPWNTSCDVILQKDDMV